MRRREGTALVETLELPLFLPFPASFFPTYLQLSLYFSLVATHPSFSLPLSLSLSLCLRLSRTLPLLHTRGLSLALVRILL